MHLGDAGHELPRLPHPRLRCDRGVARSRSRRLDEALALHADAADPGRARPAGHDRPHVAGRVHRLLQRAARRQRARLSRLRMRARHDAGAWKKPTAASSTRRSTAFRWDRSASASAISTGPGIVGRFRHRPAAALHRGQPREPHMRPSSNGLSADYGTSILVAEVDARGLPKATSRSSKSTRCVTRTGDREPLTRLSAPRCHAPIPNSWRLRPSMSASLKPTARRNGARRATLIEQCRGLSGANPVLYDFYLKRIAHLESDPSGADWNGRLEPAAA